MRRNFVEYLKSKNLFPVSVMRDSKQTHPHCSVQIIENLSGYKITTLSSLKPKTKVKIIRVLENHLNAEREKAAIGSHQYNSNRHIGLLQALRELKAKKTQPDGGCVISKLKM